MAYSADTRSIAVRAYLKARSLRKTAHMLGIGRSTISRWLRATPLIQKRRLARKFTNDVMCTIVQKLKSDPFVTRDRLVREVIAKHGMHASRSGIGLAVRRCGFTRKRTFHRVMKPGLFFQQTAFCRHAVTVPSHNIVSIDESAFWFDMRPVYGYAPMGERLHTPSSPHQHDHFSLVMAVSDQRVIGFEVRKGAFNGHAFASFLTTLRLDTHHTHLLMDNAAIHKTREVMQAVESIGLTPMFLSPYSPQFQPIEHVFSMLKAHFRQCRPDDDSISPLESVVLRVMMCVELVDALSLENCFRSCRARMHAML